MTKKNYLQSKIMKYLIQTHKVYPQIQRQIPTKIMIQNKQNYKWSQSFVNTNPLTIQLKQLLENKGYDIKGVINEYYTKTLMKINYKNQNNIDNPRIPQFENKINKLMRQNEIKEIAKKTFSLFKLKIDEKEFQIIWKPQSIQIVYENCMIQWAFNNSQFKFGQCQLNQQSKKTFNGLALGIKTGRLIYSGHFKDDKIDGEGKLCAPNGQTYQGHFKNDTKHGEGRYCFADGSTYQGDFKDDIRHGKGRYCWGQETAWKGDIYQGDLKDDSFNGKGKYFYADGQTYQGDWKDDQRHGIGKYCYVDGRIQQGDFKNGKYQGNEGSIF